MSCTVMLVIVCNKCTTTAKNIRHYLLALVIPPISSTDWQVILPRLMLCNVSVFSYHSQSKRTQVLQVSLPILTWFVLHSRCARAHSQSNAHKTDFCSFFSFLFANFSFAKHINQINVGLLLGRICIHPLQFSQFVDYYLNIPQSQGHM